MSWFSRLIKPGRARHVDHELAEEFEHHLDRRVQDLVTEGLGPEAARRQAHREFGNVARLKEEARAAHLWPDLEALFLDLRHAVRSLRRRPVFVVTVVASLSGATSATLAVASVINASVFKPLPVPAPEELIALSTSGLASDANPDSRELFSYPLFERLQTAAGGAAQLALFDDPHLAEMQEPGVDTRSEEVTSQFVSPDAFSVLRVPAADGELFSPANDRASAPRAVIVLGYDFWQGRFGGRSSVIGRTLLVDGRPHTVLGVAAPGFRGVEPGVYVDVWRPVTTFDPGVFTNPSFRSFRLLGRLAPGTTRQALAARLFPAFHDDQSALAAATVTSAPPAELASLRAQTLAIDSARSGLSLLRNRYATPVWLLFALAATISFIASANVAGLALARSESRSEDVALRLTLGASRVRVFRLLAAEGFLISGAAMAVGWSLAPVLARELAAGVVINGSPLHLDLRPDMRETLFTIVFGLVAAVIVGGLPAWRVSRGRVRPVPISGRVVASRGSRVLVGVQVAFAFSLVMSGAAFLVSLRQLTRVDVGFDATNVSVFTVANSLGPSQRPQQLQLMSDLEARVSAEPGVTGAAAAWWALFGGGKRAQRVALPGDLLSEQPAIFSRVSPRYFDVLHIPLLAGRNLTSADNDNEPVPTVVSRQFAMTYFGTDAPLGRIFVRDDAVQHVVVGVAGDAHYDDLRGGVAPMVYMPMKPPNVFVLYVRSRRAPADLHALVSQDASALGSGMRVRDQAMLTQMMQRTIESERLMASVGLPCAAFGLALAAFGVFGLLNYAVGRRTQEIGLRSALGSPRGRIGMLVLKDVTWPLVIGVAAGLVFATTTIHWVRALLFDVSATDPVVMASAIVSFAVAAAAACAWPAWRAMAVDPVIALRRE